MVVRDNMCGEMCIGLGKGEGGSMEGKRAEWRSLTFYCKKYAPDWSAIVRFRSLPEAV